MITQHNLRFNIASELEYTNHALEDAKNIWWEIKRTHYEESRITLWNGYAHSILSCVCLSFDKRWLRAHKDSTLTQVLQKRKLRS